jgi:aryl-alcohol dehydrogenase-like predicted oxidoreductase
MQYRQLGRTGLRVSTFTLGTMGFGGTGWASPVGKIDVAGAREQIAIARDAGVNLIDTADVYSNGLSEEILGEALGDSRDDVLIATKVRMPMGDGPNDAGLSRHHIIRGAEASLRRLGTDYIDLYQVHEWDGQTPLEETLTALDDLVRSGKVRYIGTSGFAGWQLVEALWTSKELGLNRFVSEQPRYSLLHRKVETEKLPMARAFGIAVLPWGPLAGGFLSGKYRGGQLPEGARLVDRLESEGYTERAFALIELLEAMAGEKGCTIGQLSIAWLMAQDGVTAPIMGPRSAEQLDEYLGALGVGVSEADCQRIDALSDGRSVLAAPRPQRVIL